MKMLHWRTKRIIHVWVFFILYFAALIIVVSLCAP